MKIKILIISLLVLFSQAFGYNYQKSEKKSFDVAQKRITAVEISNFMGNITILSTKKNDLTVKWSIYSDKDFDKKALTLWTNYEDTKL